MRRRRRSAASGVEPVRTIIRGGTDGARLADGGCRRRTSSPAGRTTTRCASGPPCRTWAPPPRRSSSSLGSGPSGGERRERRAALARSSLDGFEAGADRRGRRPPMFATGRAGLRRPDGRRRRTRIDLASAAPLERARRGRDTLSGVRDRRPAWMPLTLGRRLLLLARRSIGRRRARRSSVGTSRSLARSWAARLRTVGRERRGRLAAAARLDATASGVTSSARVRRLRSELECTRAPDPVATSRRSRGASAAARGDGTRGRSRPLRRPSSRGHEIGRAGAERCAASRLAGCGVQLVRAPQPSQSWPKSRIASMIGWSARALLGQLVLDPRRRLGVAAANDDPLGLEPAQPLGERARADARCRRARAP